MILKLLPFTLVLALAACGADGPPERPGATETPAAVTISGDARLGITHKSN